MSVLLSGQFGTWAVSVSVFSSSNLWGAIQGHIHACGAPGRSPGVYKQPYPYGAASPVPLHNLLGTFWFPVLPSLVLKPQLSSPHSAGHFQSEKISNGVRLPHPLEATALPIGEAPHPLRILGTCKSPLVTLSLPGDPFPTSAVRTGGFLLMPCLYATGHTSSLGRETAEGNAVLTLLLILDFFFNTPATIYFPGPSSTCSLHSVQAL